MTPQGRSGVRRDHYFTDPATMVEVEERLLRAESQLEELTTTHMGLADAAANAESDWKAHRDRIIVRIVDSGDKSAADYREAVARKEFDPNTGKLGEELYRSYKVTQAAAESSARAMRSIEARLGSFQTLAANIRNQT